MQMIDIWFLVVCFFGGTDKVLKEKYQNILTFKENINSGFSLLEMKAMSHLAFIASKAIKTIIGLAANAPESKRAAEEKRLLSAAFGGVVDEDFYKGFFEECRGVLAKSGNIYQSINFYAKETSLTTEDKKIARFIKERHKAGDSLSDIARNLFIQANIIHS